MAQQHVENGALTPVSGVPQEPGFTNTTAPEADTTAAGAAALPSEQLANALDRRKTPVPISGEERRKTSVDRRAAVDRRVIDIGSPTGLERRRGPGRRRTDDRRSAEEGEMTDEQFEFVLAIDTYKRLNGRPFPSWTEILEVVKQLGYRKVAASTLNLPQATGRSQAQPAPASPKSSAESEYMPG